MESNAQWYYYNYLEHDFDIVSRATVLALANWQSVLGEDSKELTVGLNVTDSKTGATQFGLKDGAFSYRGWQAGVFNPENEQVANMAILIVKSGKRVESELLLKSSPMLRIRAVKGKGKILVCNPETGDVKVTDLDGASCAEVEVFPGSIYTIYSAVTNSSPLVVVDLCSPPYQDGMERVITESEDDSQVFKDEKTKTAFWSAYKELAKEDDLF